MCGPFEANTLYVFEFISNSGRYRYVNILWLGFRTGDMPQTISKKMMKGDCFVIFTSIWLWACYCRPDDNSVNPVVQKTFSIRRKTFPHLPKKKLTNSKVYRYSFFKKKRTDFRVKTVSVSFFLLCLTSWQENSIFECRNIYDTPVKHGFKLIAKSRKKLRLWQGSENKEKCFLHFSKFFSCLILLAKTVVFCK